VLYDLERERAGIELPEDARGLGGLCLALTPCVKWKTKRLQMSNWEACPLSEAQVIYAAMDAYAGLISYEALLALKRQPPRGGGAAMALEKQPQPQRSGGGGGEAEESGEEVMGEGEFGGPHPLNPPPTARKKYCKYFNLPGGCRNGGTCQRLHVAMPPKPAGQGRKKCPYFNSFQGCKKGESCDMLHLEE